MDFNERDFQTMQMRLDNWGRWSRTANAGRSHCASAEHLYRAPRADEDRFAQSAMPINYQDAERVDRAITRVPMSCYRVFLRWIYDYRKSEREIKQQFKVTTRGLAQHERMAAMHVWMQLNAMHEEAEVAFAKQTMYNALQQFEPFHPRVPGMRAA